MVLILVPSTNQVIFILLRIPLLVPSWLPLWGWVFPVYQSADRIALHSILSSQVVNSPVFSLLFSNLQWSSRSSALQWQHPSLPVRHEYWRSLEERLYGEEHRGDYPGWRHRENPPRPNAKLRECFLESPVLHPWKWGTLLGWSRSGQAAGKCGGRCGRLCMLLSL